MLSSRHPPTVRLFGSTLFALALLLAQVAAAQPFGVEVGQRAPDFTVVDLEGEPVSLSDFRGTPLVLNFWATWCPPCREEMPLFQRVYDKLRGSATPLQVFLVDLSEERATVKAFFEDNGIALPVGLDASAKRADLPDTVIPTASVFRVYRVVGLPTTYFIDAEGIVRGKKVGQVLEADLSGFLGTLGVAWSP